ncbi:MAG: DUF308 domain-containing protein [Muribaculaceae bacterium]|nr:DUF308 domain-containing protein [Muribaculaceae bacterium]
MQQVNLKTYMQSKAWWVVVLLGILFVIGGFAYWIWPVAGYAVASVLFGWLLIAAGLVQVCVSSGANRPRGWGWWLAGGVIDMFIGFMLVRSVVLAESVFPYFMAFIFLYWGFESFVSAGMGRKYWWLSILNGILLCIVGYLFIEGGIANTIFMSSFLIAISFIYWGFTMAMAGYEMKPVKTEE